MNQRLRSLFLLSVALTAGTAVMILVLWLSYSTAEGLSASRIEPSAALEKSVLPSWLEFHPRAADVWHALRSDWLADDGWTGRSINFTYSGPRGAHFPPTLQVALWVAVSSVIYFMLSAGWRRRARSLTPYAVIALIGWLALDLGWERALLIRLQTTYERYAGLSLEGRQEAGPDRRFYPFLQEVKGHLDPADARLFIVTSEPDGYAAGRVRYHLFPANSLAAKTIGPESGLKPGDFVLLMGFSDRGRYDRRGRMLVFGDYRLPAEELLSNPRFGGLYRIAEDTGGKS